MRMKRKDKAKIILENLDKTIQVNWTFEKHYLKAIEKGLKEIEMRENEKKTSRADTPLVTIKKI